MLIQCKNQNRRKSEKKKLRKQSVDNFRLKYISKDIIHYLNIYFLFLQKRKTQAYIAYEKPNLNMKIEIG